MKNYDKEFLQWIREVINPQATPNGNSVCVDDYAKDGNTEFSYPKEFIVNGDAYSWNMSSNHTKGRHLCTHYELWFHGPAFQYRVQKIATGVLTLTKLRKGLRIIYNFYFNKI